MLLSWNDAIQAFNRRAVVTGVYTYAKYPLFPEGRHPTADWINAFRIQVKNIAGYYANPDRPLIFEEDETHGTVPARRSFLPITAPEVSAGYTLEEGQTVLQSLKADLDRMTVMVYSSCNDSSHGYRLGGAAYSLSGTPYSDRIEYNTSANTFTLYADEGGSRTETSYAAAVAAAAEAQRAQTDPEMSASAGLAGPSASFSLGPNDYSSTQYVGLYIASEVTFDRLTIPKGLVGSDLKIHHICVKGMNGGASDPYNTYLFNSSPTGWAEGYSVWNCGAAASEIDYGTDDMILPPEEQLSAYFQSVSDAIANRADYVQDPPRQIYSYRIDRSFFVFDLSSLFSEETP